MHFVIKININLEICFRFGWGRNKRAQIWFFNEDLRSK